MKYAKLKINKGGAMTTPKREKIKSAPFTAFMQTASTQEKNEFFAKVVQATTEEQRQIIAKAEGMSKVDVEQHDAEDLDAKK